MIFHSHVSLPEGKSEVYHQKKMPATGCAPSNLGQTDCCWFSATSATLCWEIPKLNGGFGAGKISAVSVGISSKPGVFLLSHWNFFQPVGLSENAAYPAKCYFEIL